jgi:ATP-binding cassette, subfamily F, member 3
VRDGLLTHYPGDWEYYSWKKAQEAAQSAKIPAVPASQGSASSYGSLQHTGGAAASSAAAPARTPVTDAAMEAEGVVTVRAATVDLGYKERKELQSRYRKVERRIVAAEQRQAALASTLSDPAHASDYELLASASAEATNVAAEINSLYEEWGRIAEALGTTVR